MLKTFSEKLEDLVEEFKTEKFRHLGFTTTENTMVRIEKCTPLKALINTVCQELADNIESTIAEKEVDRQDIIAMGISGLNVNTKHRNEKENDEIYIDSEIWESIDD